MKFVDEYRDAEAAQHYAKAIAQISTQPWTIMEICGGQTHSIAKFGIDELLPQDITLIHGPGCPVCVTPIELIDQAIATLLSLVRSLLSSLENSPCCSTHWEVGSS